MKKIFLGLSTAAFLLASGSALAATYGQDNGSISVHGTVSSGTCQIDVNGGADITLDPVAIADFTANDTAIAEKGFSVAFSNCDAAITKGTIKFLPDGSEIDSNTGYLVNANRNGAKSVQIALEDDAKAILALNTSIAVDVAITSGAGTLNLNTGYITTDKTAVTNGPVDAYVRFSVDYI